MTAKQRSDKRSAKRPARPRRFSPWDGRPRIVAWEPELPGTEIRIEVKALAVLPTASMPTRSAMTSSGSFIVMTKGSMIAKVLGPPMPGRNPTRLPIKTPRHMNMNASG